MMMFITKNDINQQVASPIIPIEWSFLIRHKYNIYSHYST
jgi:hypothetical protein